MERLWYQYFLQYHEWKDHGKVMVAIFRPLWGGDDGGGISVGGRDNGLPYA